jgi:hypothetical protein
MRVSKAVTIERAAILHRGQVYSLPKPYRHHNVIREMASFGFGQDAMWDQGFVTSAGRYVSRDMAVVLAAIAGQITFPKRTNPQDELFSEDLW